jgi:cytochrome P450 family 110
MTAPGIETGTHHAVVGTGLPPGPRSAPMVQALHLWLRPIAFVEECAARFGSAFTVRIPTFPVEVHFSDPDAIREIFTADAEDLRAGEANGAVEPLLGANSLLLLDGPRHLRQRRLLLPPFHGERMQAYGETMREIADREIDTWRIGRPFPFRASMQRITLDVILRTVFGVDDGPLLATVRERVERLLAVGTNPTILLPPLRRDLGRLSPWGRLVRARQSVYDLLDRQIERRRTPGAPARDDVLSLLVAARDEDGNPMPDDELRDQMMTLLFAGHETTATALAWALHRILQRPDVLAEIRAEHDRVVGEGPFRAEHVMRLEYLDATVKEALRLDPIIPDVGRRLVRPTRIGGWELPAGVVAAPDIHLAHRRPDRWPEPDAFRPERFLGARPGPYEFLPFGGGMRRCLGMAFALYEMKVVLARVLARVELRVAPGYVARAVRRSVTLAPSRGMPVVMGEKDTRRP